MFNNCSESNSIREKEAHCIADNRSQGSCTCQDRRTPT